MNKQMNKSTERRSGPDPCDDGKKKNGVKLNLEETFEKLERVGKGLKGLKRLGNI